MQIFNELFLDTVIQLEAFTLNYCIVSLAKDFFFSHHNHQRTKTTPDQTRTKREDEQ
jgi:hypothetical protein